MTLWEFRPSFRGGPQTLTLVWKGHLFCVGATPLAPQSPISAYQKSVLCTAAGNGRLLQTIWRQSGNGIKDLKNRNHVTPRNISQENILYAHRNLAIMLNQDVVYKSKRLKATLMYPKKRIMVKKTGVSKQETINTITRLQQACSKYLLCARHGATCQFCCWCFS